jgi:RNA polymerase sigma-70 factor (ECF subfamily)
MLSRQAFEEIYLKSFPDLMVYGRTFTSNDQLIEDTIQELFITIWQNNHKLQIKSSLENYLLISFRNNLIKKLQAAKKEIRQPIAETSTNTASIEATELKLQQLLIQLPRRQQEVIFLRYYKNKSYQEIAEILNINYQVARNFSYRAIKFLKKHKQKLLSVVLTFLLLLPISSL